MSTTETTPSGTDEPTTPNQTDAGTEQDLDDQEQAFFDTESAADGFEATIDASLLQDVLTALGAFVDEARVHLSDEGLGIRAVDPANVGMIEIRMPKLVFEHYETPGGLVGLDLERFAEVIGMANKGQLVSLALNEETRKIEVEIDGLEFELSCLDPKTIRPDPEIPDLEMNVNVTFAKAELSQGYKAANLIADHIEVAGSLEDEAVVFAAEGDSDDMQYTVDDLGAIDVLAESSSLYSLDYIKDARKGMPRSCQVEMRFGQDNPIEFTYELGDAIDVRTMIAPRIRH
ncbi:DNA polymerase sliding clamp [Halorubellus sp. PRR65]|uniref:DNA polymerase sliding clamp n=1 Tax=Halorubellus sp. PRR65 TaxID=3098148 RepID=UPI002B25832C|nr:DNA polymerase sliding clamp [Halorubellus sp. PRR65]